MNTAYTYLSMGMLRYQTVTSGSPGGSVTRYETVTNAPSVDALNGLGEQIGGSLGFLAGGVPLVAGVDYNTIPSPNGTIYHGPTRVTGLGSPGGEVHAMQGNTTSYEQTEFNIFDLINQLYELIMEW